MGDKHFRMKIIYRVCKVSNKIKHNKHNEDLRKIYKKFRKNYWEV